MFSKCLTSLLLIVVSISIAWAQDKHALTSIIIPLLLSDANQTEPSPCNDSNPNQPADDPNPLQVAGSNGRAAVSSNPIPAGYPTPQTTGICGVGISAVQLTDTDGMRINDDNTVIDKLSITGSITISANNVLIKNSLITSTGLYAINILSGYTNIIVEDTRIRQVGINGSAAVNGSSPYTLRRVHITGGADNIKAHAGILVENSYITGVYKKPGSHNDVVQVRSGSGYEFRNSTFIGPWQQSTSAFIIQAKDNNVDDVIIRDNYISGGGYSIYTNQENGYLMTNTFVTNNRFESNSWQFGWKSANVGIYSGNTQLPSP